MSEHKGRVLRQTHSLCPACLRRVPASYVDGGDGQVFMEKCCPEHGAFRTPAWQAGTDGTVPEFSAWQRLKLPSYPAVPVTTSRDGCPYDCGLCPEHAQHTCTGLVEVTARCDLCCPVCYADAGRQDVPADPPLEVLRRQLCALRAQAGNCNVQLSGGEPTVREDLPRIVALAREQGFGLVQCNTNGLRLGREEGYAARLAAAGLDSVYLQWDGMRGDICRVLRGRDILEQKKAALRACAAAGIGVVLVCTVVRGVNDDALGELLRWAVAQGSAVRGLHMQPVSSFGRFPWSLAESPRLTLPELMRLLEEQGGGMVQAAHFHPPGCEHALCSCSAVYCREEADGGSRLVFQGEEAPCCGPWDPAPPQAEEGARKAKAFVARHWRAPEQDGTCPAVPESAVEPRGMAAPQGSVGPQALVGPDGVVGAVGAGQAGTVPAVQASPPAVGAQAQRDFAGFLAASGARRRFTLSAMAFQDALNLDVERVRGCCIHVMTAQGRRIPFCLYNLTAQDGTPLYRERG